MENKIIEALNYNDTKIKLKREVLRLNIDNMKKLIDSNNEYDIVAFVGDYAEHIIATGRDINYLEDEKSMLKYLLDNMDSDKNETKSY